MKYFTPAWHSGELDEAYDPFQDYRKHLAGLLPQMPSDVQTLAAKINLHDGLLWKVVEDKEQASLLLTLRCGDLQVGYFDLALHYIEVNFSTALIASLVGLVANPSDEDLHFYSRRSEALYDEVDREEEMWVHRILFESRNAYHEITVRFKDLRLRTTPREGRYNITREIEP